MSSIGDSVHLLPTRDGIKTFTFTKRSSGTTHIIPTRLGTKSIVKSTLTGTAGTPVYTTPSRGLNKAFPYTQANNITYPDLDYDWFSSLNRYKFKFGPAWERLAHRISEISDITVTEVDSNNLAVNEFDNGDPHANMAAPWAQTRDWTLDFSEMPCSKILLPFLFNQYYWEYRWITVGGYVLINARTPVIDNMSMSISLDNGFDYSFLIDGAMNESGSFIQDGITDVYLRKSPFFYNSSYDIKYTFGWYPGDTHQGWVFYSRFWLEICTPTAFSNIHINTDRVAYKFDGWSDEDLFASYLVFLDFDDTNAAVML